MKRLSVLTFALLVLVSSCQRSQFSTTTRQYKNGKVSYINSYHKERKKTSKGKPQKSHVTEAYAQKSISGTSVRETQSDTKSEITEINPVRIPDHENLIASTSTEPAIITVNENRINSKFELIVRHKQDTLRHTPRSIGATIDKRAKQVIEFKDGRKDIVKVIAISHDTLYYKLYENTNIIFSATIDKIDTVYISKITEPLGVASTVLPVFGMFPLLGLPFAVLGLILGIISLTRIQRNPSYYKSKGVAYNGIIWGALGTIISCIFIILIINN